MTKILCVGDIHVSDKAPSSCTDSYTEDIITMLKWTADYGKQENVDAVVWAGDIFHHKNPSRNSHALVLKMIEVIRHHKNLGLDLQIVVGNHDVSADVYESAREKQPIGVLLEAGAQELNGWHPTLPLFGVPWQQRWLEQDTPMEAFNLWRSAGFGPEPRDLSQALAVTHAPIYPPKDAPNVLFELVPTSGAHGLGEAMGHTGYLYYGHIHEDHGIFEDDGVTYANMGALSRGSLHEYNLDREIKGALWTDGADTLEGTGGLKIPTPNKYAPGFTPIPVPHKPASEVFLIAEKTEEKQEKISLESFLSDIGTSTLDISSTASVVAHIQEMNTLEPNIKKKAIEILEEVG